MRLAAALAALAPGALAAGPAVLPAPILKPVSGIFLPVGPVPHRRERTLPVLLPGPAPVLPQRKPGVYVPVPEPFFPAVEALLREEKSGEVSSRQIEQLFERISKPAPASVPVAAPAPRPVQVYNEEKVLLSELGL